ncbi:hypothetical protein DL770_008905 [Monosporascus sp. CRB-9-2]|nr:hypothetical protein DL770_008905 [Monosporascus sp. CRB-9-2]
MRSGRTHGVDLQQRTPEGYELRLARRQRWERGKLAVKERMAARARRIAAARCREIIVAVRAAEVSSHVDPVQHVQDSVIGEGLTRSRLKTEKCGASNKHDIERHADPASGRCVFKGDRQRNDANRDAGDQEVEDEVQPALEAEKKGSSQSSEEPIQTQEGLGDLVLGLPVQSAEHVIQDNYAIRAYTARASA